MANLLNFLKKLFSSNDSCSELQPIVHKWLDAINESETIPENISAINIGIFETADGTYSLYMTGAIDYDEEDDDWACEEDFVPQNKYLNLSLSKASECKSEQFESIIISSLKEYVSATDNQICERILTTGFDSGELNRIK